MKSITLVISSALLAQSPFAGVLNLNPGSRSINGVTISTGGTATIENRVTPLTTVGAGLRAKKIAIVNVPVYVAQLLVSDKSKFVASDAGALNSLDQMQSVALQLSFLRNVEVSKMVTALQDGFDANGVAYDQGSNKALLDALSQGGDALNGKTFVFAGEKLGDNLEKVTFEDSQGSDHVVTGATGFVRGVFAIWLGNSNDSGITKLKGQLLQGTL